MGQKLIFKKKKKSETKSEQKSEQKKKLKPEQKVALHAVQKQMQLLQLREWLVIAGFVFGGALLRVPMQAIPSAEPITFFAILAGWLLGKKKGFLTGAAAGYLSNFFMFGGQGPWSIFQMFGWGMAGFLGGFISGIKPSKNYFLYWLKAIVPVFVVAILSTLIFDVTLNIGWSFFMPFGMAAMFLSGLPFLLIHLVSNVSFSLLLPFARKVVYEKGKFNEIELCKDVVNRINNKFNPGRVSVDRKGTK